MSIYHVKEAFLTLQGEGAMAGRTSIFCRFSGCNLWSGLEKDRATSACPFCDTQFRGTDGQNGGKFTTEASLADHLLALWPTNATEPPFIVFTGGEPTLQLTDALIRTLRDKHAILAIETNGTKPLPDTPLDWVCVSPKADQPLVITKCDELKLVFPQEKNCPKDFEHIQADHFWLSPANLPSSEMPDPSNNLAYQACINYCLENPKWKLNLQQHKFLQID